MNAEAAPGIADTLPWSRGARPVQIPAPPLFLRSGRPIAAHDVIMRLTRVMLAAGRTVARLRARQALTGVGRREFEVPV
jgi:hypothetical protein